LGTGSPHRINFFKSQDQEDQERNSVNDKIFVNLNDKRLITERLMIKAAIKFGKLPVNISENGRWP
jgi:hypothetical protein